MKKEGEHRKTSRLNSYDKAVLKDYTNKIIEVDSEPATQLGTVEKNHTYNNRLEMLRRG